MTDTDKQKIYDKLVDLLTVNCNTCLDKNLTYKILLCAFKLELIDFAEENGYATSDLWKSLARTLGLTLNIESDEIAPDTNGSTGCNCENGVCSILLESMSC